MKRHASMNRVYRLIWSQVLNTWVCCAENAKGHGKSISGRKLIAAALALMGGVFLTPLAMAGPVGGQVSAGAGTIAQTGLNTTITQSTANLAINWQDFSIGANESVRFIQPSTMSVALNRVTGQNPSQILGSLSANGQVFVLNPNGVLFGSSAQVNVGGLVASSLNLSDADLMAGNYSFGTPSPASGRGTGRGAVVNQGHLTAAPGGYIALLAPEVRNEGVISATLGTALLAAGDKVTLNLNNGSLLSYSIDQGALQALADNKQLIQADGGRVFMSAKAADALSSAVVNNTGIIQARTIQNVGGVIKLMGDMQVGTVNVGGTLDASVLPSPAGGRGAGGAGGGFIETSAAHVKVANDAHITTAAPNGLAGTWLIDPVDFTVAATGGDITGAALSTQLDTGNVIIQSVSGLTAGNGDIFVNDAINKTGTAVTSLTLQAQRNVTINSNITSTGGALNINLTPGAGGLGGTSGIFASVNTNGGVINFTNGIVLSPFGVPLYGSVLNSTLTSTDALPTLFSTGGVLDGVTLGSNLSMGGYFTVRNNLALANGVTVNLGISRLYFNSPSAQSISTSGAATINVAGGGIFQQYNQSQTLTLGTGLMVNGWGSLGESGNLGGPFNIWTPSAGNASLVNNAIINANVAGQTLSLGKFGKFTNTGSLNLSAGTLDLAGVVTTAGLGNLTRTAGTSVNLSGTLDNTGAIVDIGSAGVFKTGGLTSLTGTILNGTLKNTDAVPVLMSARPAPVLVGTVLVWGDGGTLDGVTLGSNLSTSNNLVIKNNLILADGVTLNLGNSQLFFISPGVQSISTLGAATINIAGGGIFQQYNQAHTLTLGTGLTVNGRGYIGETGYLHPVGRVWTPAAGNASLVNNGIINANTPMTLSVGRLGSFTNAGTINLSAGTLDLAGNFTAAGLGNFTRTAGTSVVLSGILDNTGATVDIGSAGLFKTGGLTYLSGTILNGTLKNTDAVPVLMGAMTGPSFVGTVMVSGGGTLDGVTLGSNLSTGNKLIIKNNLMLADGVTLNLLGNSRLYFNTAGAQSISTSGAATINIAGGGIFQQYNQAQTLTLGTGLTVNGWGSVGENGNLGYSLGMPWSPTAGNASLVNNGVINANVAGQTLVLGKNGSFSNSGVVNGSNNGIITLSGGGTHSGTFNVNSGAVLAFDSGTHHLTNANAITGNGTVNLGTGLYNNQNAVTIDGAVSAATLQAYAGSNSTLNGALNVNTLLVNSALNLNGVVAPITNLTLNTGPLNIRGSLSCTGSYTQGGRLNVGGDLNIAGITGVFYLGNINVTGNLTVSTASYIYQGLNSNNSITVGGNTTLTAGLGASIDLNNAGNNFVGAVNATGHSVSLMSVGNLKLGNINAAGSLRVPSFPASYPGNSIIPGNLIVNANGAITQAAGSKITVTGDTTLTADNGIVGTGNVKYGISLANAGNNFMGAVNATGSGINLLDSVGGLQLGNINVTGTLTALSRGGAITQAVGTGVNVSGTSTLIADNNLAGIRNAKYGITLNNASNDFRGKVSAIGNGISLTDINALMAAVTDTGNTAYTTGGSLTAWSNTAGNLTTLTTGVGSSTLFGLSHIGGNLSTSGLGTISQDASGISVAGTTSLTGSAINLSSSTTNDFVGAVSATGTGIALLDGVGGLQLGNINATGNLTALSRGGAITQAVGTGVNISGASTLIADNTLAGVNNAKYGITLNNAGNDFRGKVSAIGNGVSLTDKNALIVAVTDTSNTSLTTGGNLNVWSSTTGNLTTTQTAGYTQFGTSSIGGSLVATSPVNVTRVTGNIITVANSPTTTSNPNVTINGVVGALIP
ncbi:MAG: filamentous hemagglutinin N-terminal domain-containing protein [Gallionella sp.]|nr:filamentous hemagglutinin N-terminal domain-containing protein [Gallionella sp.]MDD4957940.1 filamentous hemagglutinin N-terminal domain-containing protein [Gallionella sp.]